MRIKHSFIDSFSAQFYNEHFFDQHSFVLQNFGFVVLSNVNLMNTAATKSLYDCKNIFKGTRHKISGSFSFISRFC